MALRRSSILKLCVWGSSGILSNFAEPNTLSLPREFTLSISLTFFLQVRNTHLHIKEANTAPAFWCSAGQCRSIQYRSKQYSFCCPEWFPSLLKLFQKEGVHVCVDFRHCFGFGNIGFFPISPHLMLMDKLLLLCIHTLQRMQWQCFGRGHSYYIVMCLKGLLLSNFWWYLCKFCMKSDHWL